MRREHSEQEPVVSVFLYATSVQQEAHPTSEIMTWE
jgi:hypothetical protein